MQLRYVPLLPLLGLQALATARRAPKLPEPPGPRAGVSGTGPALRLLIIGDSSAAGVGVAHQTEALAGRIISLLEPVCTLHWRLEARTGDTTAQTRERLRDLGPFPVDAAVTALGVNDVTHLRGKRRFVRDTAALHDDLRAHGARRIYVSAFPPVGRFPLLPQPLRRVMAHEAARFDGALTSMIDQTPDLRRITPGDFEMTEDHMASDGFHPGPKVYDVWARQIAAAIAGDLAELTQA